MVPVLTGDRSDFSLRDSYGLLSLCTVTTARLRAVDMVLTESNPYQAVDSLASLLSILTTLNPQSGHCHLTFVPSSIVVRAALTNARLVSHRGQCRSVVTVILVVSHRLPSRFGHRPFSSGIKALELLGWCMTLYTGRGDDGNTDLRDASRVSKAGSRIEAYGTVDELNALVGTIQPTGEDDVDDVLSTIQNHLHVLQAEFANPSPEADDPIIDDDHVGQLEDWIDAFDAELPPLESFVLPGGSETGSALHHARTVCRRAERRAVALAEEAGTIREQPLTYLNRLSDLLFALARLCNHREGVPEESPTY